MSATTWKERVRRWGMPALALTVFAIAATALHAELRAFRYHDVVRGLHALPGAQLALGLALTALSYAVLVGYDTLALRYVAHPLPLRRAALCSFTSYAVSQTLGFPVLTGGAVRVRFWSTWGLSTGEVAQAIGFAGATFTLGLTLMGGLVLVLEPARALAPLHLPVAARLLGTLALAVVAAYLAWSVTAARRAAWRGGERRGAGVPNDPDGAVRVGGWAFPVPRPTLAVAQLALAAADWVVASAVLYALLPHAAAAAAIPFIPFLGAFLLAQFAGVLSHVPGGIGVFEWVVVVLLRPYVPNAAAILGSLVAYRAIYYLLPFVVAVVTLVVYETRRWSARVARGAWAVGRRAPRVVPAALGAATFAAGAILLVSGATPSVHARVSALHQALPLGVIEVSHFAASVAGAALLVVAWALSRRLDAAWTLAVLALVVGIVGSLLKGLDYEEALALVGVLALLLPARRAFYRRAALTHEPFTTGWTTALLLVVGVTLWLAYFSYHHVDYSNELWWRFTTRGDAPRSLRATVGVLGALLVFGLLRLLRHAPAAAEPPSVDDVERAATIVRHTTSTEANLALLGDKSLLFSESGETFVMYGIAGRSWIALGDPVGPADEHADVAWRFKEAADEHGGWTVFYQASVEHLPLYIDLGLTLLKLGEEARVPLDKFSLDGSSRRGMRRVVSTVEKAHTRFEIVEPAAVPALLPELRRVSDEWLATKHVREKGFSLGYFDEAYLARFPIALLRCGADDRVVAFANLWRGGESDAGPGRELSIDLMRYSSEAPENAMEYLFVQLMLWGKAHGFGAFNLGMSPLSGFENRALAPLWSRAGALVFRHGEHFYNFQGLRRYKEKFGPVWEPKYLASPGGLVLPRVLANVTTLISGGLRGVVAR